jgi:hypothetical protein
MRIKQQMRDEHLSAALHLLLASNNIRWQIRTVLSAADATPLTAGGAAAMVPTSLARSLRRGAEHRGEYVRLDWGCFADVSQPSEVVQPQDAVHQLVIGLRWRVSRSYQFLHIAHVNLQELRALKARALSQVIRAPRKLIGAGVQKLNLCYARVVVEAWAKGRSSSRKLDGILCACVGLSLCAPARACNLWIGAKYNPADEPSRGEKMRAPTSLPSWALPRFEVPCSEDAPCHQDAQAGAQKANESSSCLRTVNFPNMNAKA